MVPGVQHSRLAVRHVLNELMRVVGAGVPHALAALETATDADGVRGHSSAELLELMHAAFPFLPHSELEWWLVRVWLCVNASSDRVETAWACASPLPQFCQRGTRVSFEYQHDVNLRHA